MKKNKGRQSGDGRPQRKDFTREELTFPTVATESVFITATIDAFENRDVATVDLKDAFLYTKVDLNYGALHMVLPGKLTELMVEVNTSMYRKCVISDEKGHKLLYVELQKAPYGTLNASLLFCQKLVK